MSTTMFAMRVQERMDELGLSIKELADKTEATYEHVRKIVRGTTYPSRYYLRVLCEVLDINLQETRDILEQDKLSVVWDKLSYRQRDVFLDRVKKAS